MKCADAATAHGTPPKTGSDAADDGEPRAGKAWTLRAPSSQQQRHALAEFKTKGCQALDGRAKQGLGQAASAGGLFAAQEQEKKRMMRIFAAGGWSLGWALPARGVWVGQRDRRLNRTVRY